MAFPNPAKDPTAFHDHLKAANLDFAICAFDHYLAWPADSSNHLEEITANEWCEQMDALLVSSMVLFVFCVADVSIGKGQSRDVSISRSSCCHFSTRRPMHTDYHPH